MPRGSKIQITALDLSLLNEMSQGVPSDLSMGSIISWTCHLCKGQWQAPYYKRAIAKQGCPFCAGQKVLSGFNDLLSQFPRIALEYSPSNEVRADEISYGSGRTVIWDCGHCKQQYTSIVYNRTHLGRGCPYCAGKKPIVGLNDFATLRPLIVSEWSDKNDSTPDQYTLFSNKSVIWSCARGHEWMAQIATRAGGKGCKPCSRQESKGEKEVADFIASFYSGTLIANDRKLLAGLELDIFLPQKNLAIEYNGVYWHSNAFLARRKVTAEELHKSKMNKCAAKQVRLLYVWEDDWLTTPELICQALRTVITDDSDIDPILQIVSKG